MTTRGDLERKLDFAFTLYDSDNNGILTKEKMKPVVYGMLDLIVRYELVWYFNMILTEFVFNRVLKETTLKI